MRTTTRLLISSLPFLLPQSSLGLFTVLEPHPGAGKYRSATYTHYGPSSSSIIKGKTVYLRGEDVCNPFKEAVQGRVVLTDRLDMRCNLGECVSVHARSRLPGCLAFFPVLVIMLITIFWTSGLPSTSLSQMSCIHLLIKRGPWRWCISSLRYRLDLW